MPSASVPLWAVRDAFGSSKVVKVYPAWAGRTQRLRIAKVRLSMVRRNIVLLSLDRFRHPRPGNEEVLPHEFALFHHAEAVFAAAQIRGTGVVGAEAELRARRFGGLDESG